MNELEVFRERFKNAKGKDLSRLMTEMERSFNIPMVNDEEYNNSNKEVIELYREISNSRDI